MVVFFCFSHLLSLAFSSDLLRTIPTNLPKAERTGAEFVSSQISNSNKLQTDYKRMAQINSSRTKVNLILIKNYRDSF